jgi:hypothetical protein
MEHLTAAFKENFKRDATSRWRDSAEVWEITQTHGQSVEDFINKVQAKAIRANLSPEQTLFSTIHGLLPDYRHAVLQHEPTSIADVRRWALIAEASQLDKSRDTITEAVRRLENKFDTLQAAVAETGQKQRSNSPRVHFQNQNPGQNYQAARNYSREPSPVPWAKSPRTDEQRGRQTNTQERSRSDRPQWNQTRQGQESWQDRSRQRSNSGDQPRNQFSTTGRRCFTCDSYTVHDRFTCPAIKFNAQCYNCGKRGHYARCCKARPNNRQN